MTDSEAAIADMLRAMAQLFETRAAIQRGFYEHLTETDSRYAGHISGKQAAYYEAAHECREAANRMQETT